jgi:hypothetical protein
MLDTLEPTGPLQANLPVTVVNQPIGRMHSTCLIRLTGRE